MLLDLLRLLRSKSTKAAPAATAILVFAFEARQYGRSGYAFRKGSPRNPSSALLTKAADHGSLYAHSSGLSMLPGGRLLPAM